MRTLRIAVFALLGVISILMLEHTARADDAVKVVAASDKYNIAFLLPSDRFVVEENKEESKTLLVISLRDKQKVADTTLVAWLYNEPERQFPDAKAWTLKELQVLQEKSVWNENRGAVSKEKDPTVSEIALGSGEKAVLIRSELAIPNDSNQNGAESCKKDWGENKKCEYRQVAFLYFERQVADQKIWFQVFLSNFKKWSDQSEAISMIANGIQYAVSASAALGN